MHLPARPDHQTAGVPKRGTRCGVPELDSGNHIAAQAPASFPHPLSAFGSGPRKRRRCESKIQITEEAVRDVAMLLAIAYERHAAMRQLAERTNAKLSQLAREKELVGSALEKLSAGVSGLARTVSSPGPEAKAATGSPRRDPSTRPRNSTGSSLSCSKRKLPRSAGSHADELQRSLAAVQPLVGADDDVEQEKLNPRTWSRKSAMTVLPV